MDDFLRKRAQKSGANVLNGLFMNMEQKQGPEGAYTLHFNNYEAGGKVGKPETLEVDLVVGADGANSRVAREIDAGDYDYAIAFQVSPPPPLPHPPTPAGLSHACRAPRQLALSGHLI